MGAQIPIEITPAEVQGQMGSLRLIDVREPFEFELARIDGAELIPISSIPKALALLEREEKPIVVFCHHGVRSLRAVAWLREQGIENCTSMAGGIDRWSQEIDPAVRRY